MIDENHMGLGTVRRLLDGADGATNGGSGPHQVQLVVTGNCSLSRRGARIFFAAVLVGTLIVSGGWALFGFWPVLPFAGLELFGVGLALGLSMRSGSYREIISVTPSEVCIERGSRQTRQITRLTRAWTEVALERSAYRWHPARLLIRAHGRELEIGKMLTEDERSQLHLRLRGLIGAAGQ